MTKDRRILIRNTAEIHDPFKMSKLELSNRAKIQKIGLKKRFPQLPDNIIQSTWSGIVSRSRNSSQIFEKIDTNVYVAGCYNGSGIGVGTLRGREHDEDAGFVECCYCCCCCRGDFNHHAASDDDSCAAASPWWWSSSTP